MLWLRLLPGASLAPSSDPSTDGFPPLLVDFDPVVTKESDDEVNLLLGVKAQLRFFFLLLPQSVQCLRQMRDLDRRRAPSFLFKRRLD